MKRGMRLPVAAAVALVLLPGCRSPGSAGQVSAEWTSADTTIGSGKLAQAATATWCPQSGILMLVASGADTGVAVRYRSDAIRGGEYPVVDTTSTRQPAGIVALRLPQATRLLAFSSDSGTLTLDPTDGALVSGRFQAWFREPGTGVPVALAGRFTRVAVTPEAPGCEAALRPTASPQ